MKDIKIKVIKDTPFHDENDIITTLDFRIYYSSISVKFPMNKDLIDYLNSKPKKICNFFEVVY
jgi:hypothetical protein